MACVRHPDGDGPDWCMDCHPERYAHDVPHARRTDPGTSQLSSFETERREGTTTTLCPDSLKHLCLGVIARRPSTGREVGRILHRDGAWKRVSDLKNAGLIYPTGDVRRDPVTESLGDVMAITEHGQRVLDLLERGEAVRLNGPRA